MTLENGFLKGERFINIEVVIEKTSLSRSTIYRYCNQGQFPEPIQIGANRVAWLESDINIWMADRITESRTDRNIGTLADFGEGARELGRNDSDGMLFQRSSSVSANTA